MIETLNHRVFAVLAAPSVLLGGGLVAMRILAEWLVLLGPMALILLWALGIHQERRAAVAAGLTALLALGIAHVASSLVMVPRPFMDGIAANILDHAPDSSFPSDHCSLLFGLSFGFLAFRPARLPHLWAVLLIVGLAVGWARIRLGAHYPLDILGAALIAGVSAWIVATRWGRAGADGLSRAGEHLFGTLRQRSRGLGRR